MDRRLTAYVLKYLLEHRFESKAEMARQLGMRQRTIEKVFANLDVAKAGILQRPQAHIQFSGHPCFCQKPFFQHGLKEKRDKPMILH